MEYIRAFEKRIQQRYPTIHLRWIESSRRLEVWEKHDGKAGGGWRKLWTYRNADGTAEPIVFDTLMNWLLKADTRHWPERYDMFEEIMKARKERETAGDGALQETVKTLINEDYNYLKGTRTFFMDPSSMPRRTSTLPPHVQESLRKKGHTNEVPI